MHGGSLIVLFNPIREIQMAELEELRVNVVLDLFQQLTSRLLEHWFVFCRYRNGNVTIGAL
jgi:hypothetical protein